MMGAAVVKLFSVKTVEGSAVKITVKSGKVKVDEANVVVCRIGGDAVFVMPARAAVGRLVEKQTDAEQLLALTRSGRWHPAYLLCRLPCR